MRIEIRISGFGGQGVVLAGYIIGKAVTLYSQQEAVMTQSYGPEARGGASSANIIISDEPIDYPFVQSADILVALSQEGYTRYRPKTKPQALILADQDLVSPDQGDLVYAIPATHFAGELGKRIVANMVMLGFLSSTSGVVERIWMEKTIESSVKPNTLSLNIQAFSKGYEYGLHEVKIPDQHWAYQPGETNNRR